MERYSRIDAGQDSACLDFAITSGNQLVMASYYGRSLETIRAVGACFNSKYACFTIRGNHCRPINLFCRGKFSTYVTPIDKGKDPFFHGMAFSEKIGSQFLFVTDSNKEMLFYYFLMENFNLPLLYEWRGELFRWALANGSIDMNRHVTYFGLSDNQRTMIVNGRESSLNEVMLITSHLTEERLKSGVSELLKGGLIWISKSPQKPLEFNGLDGYFNSYGTKVVSNLEKQLHPLTAYEGNVDDFTLKSKRLYPQQVAMVHGVKALLLGTGNHKERRKTASSYAILNEGMGCGKTVQGAAICEALKVAPLLNSMSLKEVYSDRESVKYRNIIMCPGHLVEKWAAELRDEVPYAKVTILRHFEQVVDLWKRGSERTGREFYVISKDFAKLSYQEEPVPVKERIAFFHRRICKSCGKEVKGTECSCGSTTWRLERTEETLYGMQCPCCGNILLPVGKKISVDEEGNYSTLKAKDFATHNSANDFCIYCHQSMWQPHTKNLAIVGSKEKHSPWLRATHYANKAHKGKKSVWVHENYMDEYFRSVGEKPITCKTTEGVRRYDPATFIKNHMKGFFDVAIFDEVHTLKGGDSAQGHAMHAIVKASKKQLCLTGTIAGGYADHLFYMLFRLDPQRMINEGFTWGGVTKFSEQYGCIETVYAAEKDRHGEYNVSSRGRKLSEPKCKPGISPLIFSKFLLDKTVFLDITDMSKYLPPLKEQVVLVDVKKEGPEIVAYNHYNKVINSLNRYANSGFGMTVLSTMLQFALSYMDKPYETGPIMNPLVEKHVLVNVNDYLEFKDINMMTSKEEKMVEIVKSELSENRNCFVFAEYTNSPATCVTGRIRDLLLYHVGLKPNEVVILESSTVSAQEREEWIHKQAANGMRVCIVNPKCVETGCALASVA